LAERYLLDTSALSEFAPNRPPMQGKLASWFAAREARLFLAAVSLAEIGEGIAQLHRSGGHQRADRLRRWLDDMLDRYEHRVLAFDIRAASIAGEMADAATASGRHPGLADVLIASTAKAHDLIVVSRNLKHFAALDVPCHDPFESV
jgi:predicted nucleic acid-binding protein